MGSQIAQTRQRRAGNAGFGQQLQHDIVRMGKQHIQLVIAIHLLWKRMG